MSNFGYFEFIYNKHNGMMTLVINELNISKSTFFRLKKKLNKKNKLNKNPLSKVKNNNHIDNKESPVKNDPRLLAVIDRMFDIALGNVRNVSKVSADMCLGIVNMFGHYINAKKLAIAMSNKNDKEKESSVLDLVNHRNE